MRRTKEIELFGRKVTLAERNAAEILALYDIAKNGNDVSEDIKLRAIAISDALSINKRRFCFVSNRRFSARYILGHLSIKQVIELFDELNILEGNDPEDKKKVESLSQEKSQEQP